MPHHKKDGQPIEVSKLLGPNATEYARTCLYLSSVNSPINEKSRFNMRTDGHGVLKELLREPVQTAAILTTSLAIMLLDMPRTISERRQEIFGS